MHTVLVASVDWTQVLLHALTTFGIVATAYFAYAAKRDAKTVREEIRTPSGKPIGEVAEFTHDTAIANNVHLMALGEKKKAAARKPRTR